MTNIARPRKLVIVNPAGGCVAALDLSVLSTWTDDPDDLDWSVAKKGQPIVRHNGHSSVKDAVVAIVTVADMVKVGCHWLEGEEEGDAEVASSLLYHNLKAAGYVMDFDSLTDAVKFATLAGPAPERIVLDATLNPPIKEG